jgi:hypothetical protein
MLEFFLVIGIVFALLASATWLMIRLIRKHGIPELPAEIALLDRLMHEGREWEGMKSLEFVEERFGRRLYSGTYLAEEGVWRLMVETDGELVVAYRASLKHRASWWLGGVRESCLKSPAPRIILCGE